MKFASPDSSAMAAMLLQLRMVAATACRGRGTCQALTFSRNSDLTLHANRRAANFNSLLAMQARRRAAPMRAK
jgi:hypothetical protein